MILGGDQISVLELFESEILIPLSVGGRERTSLGGRLRGFMKKRIVAGELIFLWLRERTRSFIVFPINSRASPKNFFYGVFKMRSDCSIFKCKIWVVGIKSRVPAIRSRSSNMILVAMMAIGIERTIGDKMILFAMVTNLQ